MWSKNTCPQKTYVCSLLSGSLQCLFYLTCVHPVCLTDEVNGFFAGESVACRRAWCFFLYVLLRTTFDVFAIMNSCVARVYVPPTRGCSDSILSAVVIDIQIADSLIK